jgi:hypothetical protein
MIFNLFIVLYPDVLSGYMGFTYFKNLEFIAIAECINPRINIQRTNICTI